MPEELKAQAAGATRHIQELTERAAAVQAIADGDGHNAAIAIVPEGHGVALIDTERLQDQPKRPRGTATFDDLDGFAGYVNAHRSDATTVWIHHDPDDLGKGARPIGSVQAVLDDHQAGDTANWGEHRAELPIRTTPQWRHWIAGDGSHHDQEDFSEHLRQGLSEIKTPDAATVLEVAENLTVTNSATLTSVRRGGGDLRIEHQEEQTARSGSGKSETEIPETFVLAISPFVGAPPVEIQGRLKYRNAGGHLKLGYTLARPGEALADAVLTLEKDTRSALSGTLNDRIYRGQPIVEQERTRVLPTPEIETVQQG